MPFDLLLPLLGLFVPFIVAAVLMPRIRVRLDDVNRATGSRPAADIEEELSALRFRS